MNNREMLKTITPQEQELIRMVLERAKQKQKERGGDNKERIANGITNLNIKPSSNSYYWGCIW